MRSREIAILLVSFIAVSLLQSTPAVSAQIPEYIDDGPYIDKIIYTEMHNQNYRVLQLQSGEIDMDTSYLYPFFDSYDLEVLDADPDIDIARTLKNGYRYVGFDCEMFPTNISGFRRAFAFAFNKTKVATEIMDGLSQTHDSIVPYLNPFCIEEDLDWHYYNSRPDLGNAILDDLGFTIDSTTGIRKAPNGDSFSILILHPDLDPYRQIAELAVEAFELLHISADNTPPCNCELNNQMVVFDQGFEDFDLSWFANLYWSEYPGDVYTFSTGFSNSTFDSWRNQLLYSSNYEDTYEAAAEMQKILHYNVPLLVVSQDVLLQPYRNDRFERHIMDSMCSISGPWTMLSIKPIDSTHGGTVVVGVSARLESFNFLTARTSAWAYGKNHIFSNIHYALYTKAPDQEPYPQLAETMHIETHEDNPSILEGHTRFTMDIRNDIEWTDGVPVTVDDIIFTFNYALETIEFGNPMGDDLTELTGLYSPTPHRVVIEFATESYWHFNKFVYEYILPKHIFEGYEPDEWNEWSLITNGDGNSLNCGPFMLTDFEYGEWYELSARNPWSEDGEDDFVGNYVVILSASEDIQTVFPYFTIRWELDWEVIWLDNQVVDEDGYNLTSTPSFASFSYSVLMDGELYLSDTRNGNSAINNLDVNFFDSTLAPGQHNVTLLVETEDKILQIDSVIVTIILPSSSITFIVGLTLPSIAYVVLLYIGRFRARKRSNIVE